MLITDYSSVSWDVYYQENRWYFIPLIWKPMRKSREAIWTTKRCFGDLAWDQNQLVDLIGEYARNGFRENRNFRKKR